MDIVVSYWDSSVQKSCVQYLTSKFLNYWSAENLNLCLNEALKELDLSRMIQLAMDGPHVNWSLYDTISSTREKRNFPAPVICLYILTVAATIFSMELSNLVALKQNGR